MVTRLVARFAVHFVFTAVSVLLLAYLLLLAFNKKILSNDTRIVRALTEQFAPPNDWREPVAVHEVPPFIDTTWAKPEFSLPYYGDYDIEFIVNAKDFVPLDQVHGMALNAYISCSNPDKVSGYAGRYGHRMVGYGDESINANAHAEKLQEIQKPYGVGYKLGTFSAGGDLPLNKPVRCQIRLTEWVLQNGPGHLYVTRSRDTGFW